MKRHENLVDLNKFVGYALSKKKKKTEKNVSKNFFNTVALLLVILDKFVNAMLTLKAKRTFKIVTLFGISKRKCIIL